MIEHASELVAVCGGALVVGMTSQVLIAATTTRKRLRHERDGIARFMLDGRTGAQKARTRPAVSATTGDDSSRE